jgi:choline kinase
MVETLFCAEQEMDDEILVCYADILYEKQVIEKILQSEVNIGVTVDTDYWPYWQARLDNPEEDTESLVIDEERIVELGDTHCSRDKAEVRYVGLIKFSREGVEALKKVYHENKEKYFDKDEPWLRSKSFKKAYMTCILQALVNAGHKVSPIKISHGWMEFDTNEDYEKANEWLGTGAIKQFINLEN